MVRKLIFEILEFTEYCCSFYDKEDPTAVYPIATRQEIEEAIYKLLTNDHQTIKCEIDFDSLDREKVRKIIQPEYRY